MLIRSRVLLTILAGLAALAACAAPATSDTPTPAGRVVRAIYESTPPPMTRTPLPTDTAVVPTLLPATATTRPDLAPSIDAYLSGLARAQSFSGAVLIARGGKVLLAKGYGMADSEKSVPNTPRTRFRIASLTKQFTAMSILMLAAQGKLDVQDHVCKYIPDCPGAWQTVTLHHLLTHTSGIPDVFQTATGPKPKTGLDLVNLFKDNALSFEPGRQYSYSNAGYIVLGAVVERVSGQSYGDFVEQRILRPLGMKDSGLGYSYVQQALGYNPIGSRTPIVDAFYPFSAGGLYSTVQDLYAWDQALYTEKLVPGKYIQLMYTPQVKVPERPGATYGYGAQMESYGRHQMVGHWGTFTGYTSTFWRFPDDQATLIILRNHEPGLPDPAVEPLLRMLFGE